MLQPLLCADWKLATIYNQSDLQLQGAYRLINKSGFGKRSKLKKASTFVDRRIKLATKKPFVIIDYTVPTHVQSQGHLCITAVNAQSQTYTICFDSRPKHALIWNRLQTKEVAVHEDTSQDGLDGFADGSLIARAVLTLDDKTVARAMQSYEVDFNRVEFDLTIHGKAGLYSLELSEVE